MTVIAMTREMGTLGKDVAAGVADRLGIEIVHHEIVERHLAERLQTTESAVHRFLEGEASLWERWKIDSKKLSRFTAVDILELATRGNVLIRGWGAAQLLRDVPHVICVRICAPMSKRIDEMKRRLTLDRTDLARREIERSDDAHERAVQRQFQADWKDPTGYDLVLNTGYVPIDTAIAILQQLAKSGAYEPTEASRGQLQDKLLQAQAQTVIDEYVSDSPTGTNLGVVVTQGNVVVDGAVSGGGSIRGAIAAIEKIEGVTSVTNNTVSVPSGYGP
jgi:cytidylate kinase